MTTTETVPEPASSQGRVASITIAQSIGLLVLFYGFYFASAAFLAVSTSALRVTLTPGIGPLIQLCIAWPLTIFTAIRLMDSDIARLVPQDSFSPRLLPPLILGSFGATVLLLALAGLITFPEGLEERLATTDHSPAVLFIAVIVIAPVAEELFYRGVLLRGLSQRYTQHTAIWASAILFAVMHLNPWQAVIALPLGVVYGWLTIRTRSVIPAILSHAAVNGTANFVLLPLGISLYGVERGMSAEGLPDSFLILGMATALLGAGGVWHQLRSQSGAKQNAVSVGA